MKFDHVIKNLIRKIYNYITDLHVNEEIYNIELQRRANTSTTTYLLQNIYFYKNKIKNLILKVYDRKNKLQLPEYMIEMTRMYIYEKEFSRYDIVRLNFKVNRCV